MVDLTKKKTLSEYDTEALIDGDTVVTYRSTNAVGDKVFRGEIVEGTAASISDGTSTDLKMYSDKALKDSLNTGAIPIGTAAEIETGTDTTAKLYAPDQLNGAVKDIAVAQYPGRAAMKAAIGLAAGDVVYLSEGGRSGTFEYLVGDYSAEVAADPLEGVYVALDSDPDGSDGVLKRATSMFFPQFWGVVGDGTDESTAMEAVATSGLTIHFPNPPVYYSFKDIKRAKGTVFIGSSKPLYTPDSASEFTGMSAFVLATGGTYFWLPDDGESRVEEIEDTNILYYGRGDATYFSEALSRYNNTSCGFYNMFAGIGVDGYAREVQSVIPNCYRNKYGARNLIDSKILGGNINVNEDGVNCQAGANSNEFSSVRVEFNTNRGYVFTGCSDNNITGGLVDRSQKEGLSASLSANISVSGTRFRRNGVDLTSGHINLDNSEVVLNGVVTRSGNSIDGGGGVSCPLLALRVNGGDYVGIGDCDLTGVAAGGEYTDIVVLPDSYDFCANAGLTDASKHDLKTVRNSRYMTAAIQTGSITTTNSAVTSVDFHKISTFSRRRLTLNILARNASTGGTFAGELAYYISRESGSASIVFVAKTYDRTGTDVGVTVSESIQLEISNIATDASTFDVTVTNNSADTVNVDIEIT